MIDAILQWADEQDRFKEGFAQIDRHANPNTFFCDVLNANQRTPNGEIIEHRLVMKGEGPAVSIMRDNAGDPSFLADITSQGDPYRGLREHEILAAAPATTFRIVKLSEIDTFRVTVEGPDQTTEGKVETPNTGLSCTGGPELYRNLVLALAEYAETQMANGKGGDCWIPSSAAISLMRLPDSEGGQDGRVHLLRAEKSLLEEASQEGDRIETMALTIKELLSLLDAVDCLLEDCPHLLQLAPPEAQPSPPAPWWSALMSSRVTQMATALFLLGGAALSMTRSSWYGERASAFAAAWPSAAVRSRAKAGVRLTPANLDLDSSTMADLCQAVEGELRRRATLAGQPAWKNLGSFAMEYQVVVAQDGKVLGSRPVNGIASHFYAALNLGNYKAPLEEIDREARPVVLKATITNRVVDGEVSPEVVVRGWEDDDSLRSWGMTPSPEEP